MYKKGKKSSKAIKSSQNLIKDKQSKKSVLVRTKNTKCNKVMRQLIKDVEQLAEELQAEKESQQQQAYAGPFSCSLKEQKTNSY